MKVYRVSYRGYKDEHQGYSFHESKREANQAAKDSITKESAESDDMTTAEVEGPFEIQLTKQGLLGALNRFGRHPDNG